MKYILIIFTLLPLSGLRAQGKFYGGNGQGWSVSNILNSSIALPNGIESVLYSPATNPVSNILTLRQTYRGPYQLVNLQGQLVQAGFLDGNEISVNTLPNGIYICILGHHSFRLMIYRE